MNLPSLTLKANHVLTAQQGVQCATKACVTPGDCPIIQGWLLQHLALVFVMLKTAILAIIFKFSFYKLNSIYFMANRLICYYSLNKVCLYLNSFIPTITLFCDGLKWRHVITWSTSRSCRLSLHGVISSLFLINVNVCINFSSRHNLTFISLVGDSICRVVQTQLAFNATYSAFKVW